MATSGGPSTPQAISLINGKARANSFITTHQVDDLSDSEDNLLSIAIERSLVDSRPTPSKMTSSSNITAVSHSIEDIDIYEVAPPSRLETVLTLAGTSQSHARTSLTTPGPSTSVFGKPNLLSPIRKQHLSATSNKSDVVAVDKIPVEPSTPSKVGTVSTLFGTPTLLTPLEKNNSSTPFETLPTSQVTSAPVREFLQPQSDSEEDLEAVPVDVASASLDLSIPSSTSVGQDEAVQTQDSHPPPPLTIQPLFSHNPEDDMIEWSRTPSPVPDSQSASATQDQEWDAANETDARVEEGEFARFISQVKGKGIDDVRKEIDDEINNLNRQRRAAMRDSEDLTQQMITQIMVGLLFTSIFLAQGRL
jgi:DNA excision repair protein ERCC-5